MISKHSQNWHLIIIIVVTLASSLFELSCYSTMMIALDHVLSNNFIILSTWMSVLSIEKSLCKERGCCCNWYFTNKIFFSLPHFRDIPNTQVYLMKWMNASQCDCIWSECLLLLLLLYSLKVSLLIWNHNDI